MGVNGQRLAPPVQMLAGTNSVPNGVDVMFVGGGGENTGRRVQPAGMVGPPGQQKLIYYVAPPPGMAQPGAQQQQVPPNRQHHQPS